MALSGLKQAVIAYKVRASDKEPLDTDGNPIVVDGVPTGRKQAIAILFGTANPDPALYDVQIIFTQGVDVQGVPSVEYSDDCPVAYIYTDVPAGSTVILTDTNPQAVVVVTSSGPWTVSGPAGVIVAPEEGPAGPTVVTLTRDVDGQGFVVFTETSTGATAKVYVLSIDTEVWVLATGFWNDFGVWQYLALWEY